MKAVLLTLTEVSEHEPLTVGRTLGECMVGGQTLRAALADRLRQAGCQVAQEQEIASGRGSEGRRLFVREDAWLSPALLQRLCAASGPAAVMAPDARNLPLAWVGLPSAPLPDDAERLRLDGDSFRIRYPWDLLRINDLLQEQMQGDAIEGQVSARAEVAGHLRLGAGSSVLPGAYIEGNVTIGRNCRIGPNCYLRGPTAIGDDCRVGQAVEIKRSILMADCTVGHLSYVGDSVLGEKVNFGAGTITANLRHDNRNPRSLINGRLVEAGSRKLGAIVGDNVHTGVHTSIYPGRKLWPGAMTRPGAIVWRDLGAPDRENASRIAV